VILNGWTSGGPGDGKMYLSGNKKRASALFI